MTKPLSALFALLLVCLPLASRPAARRRRAPAPRPQAAALHNAHALATFLEALAAPAEGPIRILHFGDSHTAADYWSGQLRRRLQDRFGDGGPGCLLPGRPWRGYPHAGVRFGTGQAWPAQGLRSKDCDGWVGLPGTGLTPVEGEAFQVRAAFGEFQVTLLGPGQAPVLADWTVEDGAPAPAVSVPRVASEDLGEGRILETFALKGLPPGECRELSLRLPAGARLLGVDLGSGRPGIVYDECGLNGAELTDLDRWNPALRRQLLAAARPALVVLAYGTNEVGLSPADRPGYEARARKVLAAVREESGAPVLVVGPLDRPGRLKRQRAALKEGAAWLIPFLTRASQEAGCAFWDARQAMGGPGSMARWRRNGQAQKDLVHLNGAGYQRLGDLLADALLEALKASRHPLTGAGPVSRRQPPARPAR